MRIDFVNGPSIEGKSVDQALKILHSFCHDTAVQVMKMNNEIEDLKSKIYRMENQR